MAEVVDAITSLAVRGAPAIGLAGALGVALSAHLHRTPAGLDEEAVRADARRLAAARPTAVNLAWAVQRALERLPAGPDAVLAEAHAMLEEDIAVNRAAADRAAALVRTVTADRPLRLLTHCNTGRLATAAVGTALGAILSLAADGRVHEVLVGETRPLLQGARLTAWELAEAGVPHRLCTDSAGPAAIARGMVDCVLVGADRIAANGDTANKIGTYALAAAAARHHVPFIVVAPESTWDHTIPDGTRITIEERDGAEVTTYAGRPTAPPGTAAYNPAFDVTPAALITAIVTEHRTVHPASAPAEPGRELADVCRTLHRNGWMPGTAGNLSTRSDTHPHHALITPSGRDKDTLHPGDMVLVDAATAQPVRTARSARPAVRPSAEAAIHAAVYRHTPARAVIHVHAPYATAVATRTGGGNDLLLEHHELLKGLHLPDPARTVLPVFTNWPDVGRIADDVARHLTTHPEPAPALLIADHGITVWGQDLTQAKRRLECLESICHLLLLTGAALTTAL